MSSSQKNKPISYYKEKYKMGECVVALNEYIENNPDKKFTNFVYRMVAPKNSNYVSNMRCVYFKETRLNNHVILTDQERYVIDPLFGIERMNIDDYVKYLVEHDLLDIKPEFTEIMLDIQPLLEKHRKECRSQFVDTDMILCSVIIDLQTKEVSTL